MSNELVFYDNEICEEIVSNFEGNITAYACEKQPKIAKYLIENDLFDYETRVTLLSKYRDITYLMIAAIYNPLLFRYLLSLEESKKYINVKCGNEYTLLTYACQSHNNESLKYFLESELSIEIKNNQLKLKNVFDLTLYDFLNICLKNKSKTALRMINRFIIQNNPDGNLYDYYPIYHNGLTNNQHLYAGNLIFELEG